MNSLKTLTKEIQGNNNSLSKFLHKDKPSLDNLLSKVKMYTCHVDSITIYYDALFSWNEVVENLNLASKILIDGVKVYSKVIVAAWDNSEMSTYGGELTYREIQYNNNERVV